MIKFKSTAIAVLVSITLRAVPLFAGTIITSNLPTNTVIINIDARADGIHSYNSDQSLFYSPFNLNGTLLEYSITPGTYSFRIIDPLDAVALFPGLTSAQTNQIFTAWTFNSPWVENYMVFDSSAATNSGLFQIFDGAYSAATTFTSDPASAYNEALTNGTYNEIRPALTGTNATGRDGTNFYTSYTFSTNETLIFIAPDYDLSDNSGGISVVISVVIPKPVITFVTVSNTNLNFACANGLAGHSYYLLSSATLSLPLNQWSSVATNSVSVAGNFSIQATNVYSRSTPQRFFILQMH